MRARVIDSSSIILLKEIPRVVRGRVTAHLDSMVEDGILIYPPEVLGELERFTDTKHPSKPDEPLVWARRNERKACRHGHLFDGAKTVLDRVRNLIDAEKVAVGGVDDADPYVVALAILLKEAREEVLNHYGRLSAEATEDISFGRCRTLRNSLGHFSGFSNL